MPPRLWPLRSPIPILHHRRSVSNLSLAGSHALVTGASRGIGLSVARLLSAHGASLTLISRDISRLESAGSSVSGPASLVPGDVSDPAFWADLALPPRVDILVNAAGITTVGPFVRSAQEAAEGVVRTNLLGTMMACRAVGKKMLRQPKDGKGARGAIVNVASLLGVQGGAGSAAYAASKAGVVGFSRALAAEMGGAGVRVNTVLPGYVTSDMTDGKFNLEGHFHFTTLLCMLWRQQGYMKPLWTDGKALPSPKDPVSTTFIHHHVVAMPVNSPLMTFSQP